jgi:3-oxoacyl-[acyl-carrier-protein] synthase II
MRRHIDPAHAAVISGASGAPAVTAEESVFLRGLGLPVRATATAFGHSLEPSFPANLAVAAISVSRKKMFGPLEATDPEAPMAAELRQVLVTAWGHWRGEASAVVEAA